MLTIDYRDKSPLYEQLVRRVEELVSKGAFQSGDQLPSVRSLATQLSINPNTIQRAYAELDKLGITVSVKGKGSFVSEDLQALTALKKQEYFALFYDAAEQLLRCGVSREELLQNCTRYLAAGEKAGVTP